MLSTLLTLVATTLMSLDPSTMDTSFLERISQLEQRFQKFQVAGVDTVRVYGSLKAGYAVNIDDQEAAAEPAGVNGACCFDNDSCLNTSASQCAFDGGHYQGDGTVCSGVDCTGGGGGTSGACCATDGSCSILSPAACHSGGGTYHGDHSVCSPNPCPVTPTGACCKSGICDIETSAACETGGGIYQGDGTVCDPNPCPPVSGGACCHCDTGCTHVASRFDCVFGAYQGDGTVCTPVDPCADTTTLGGCCVCTGPGSPGFCAAFTTANSCACLGQEFYSSGSIFHPGNNCTGGTCFGDMC